MFEVPVATTRYYGVDLGVQRIGSKQRIDAVAVGLWGKRTDHEVRGYEIKVSRADLLTELRDPGKADAGIAQCDSWWLALSDPGLLKDSDPLPDGWGVLACVGSGMRVLRQADRRPGEHSGQFIAGLMQAQLRSSTWRRASGYAAGYTRGVSEAKRVYSHRTPALLAEQMCPWRQTHRHANAGGPGGPAESHTSFHHGDPCPYEAVAAALRGDLDPTGAGAFTTPLGA